MAALSERAATAERSPLLVPVDAALRAYANLLFSRSRVTGDARPRGDGGRPERVPPRSPGRSSRRRRRRARVGLALGGDRRSPLRVQRDPRRARCRARLRARPAGGARARALRRWRARSRSSLTAALVVARGQGGGSSAPVDPVHRRRLALRRGRPAARARVPGRPRPPRRSEALREAALGGARVARLSPASPPPARSILAALVVHSRIATLLAALGVGLVALIGVTRAGSALRADGAAARARPRFLTATAIGGVWFVPSAASFALAVFGAVVSIAITASIARPLGALGLPPLILPFNLAVLAVLLAARQRARDASPKSVDFAPGAPEENLAYVQTRRARFRALYGIDFHLPFRGAWVCTQGVDGALTHQGQWRHAFDFEVEDAPGRRLSGGGRAARATIFCHRLPRSWPRPTGRRREGRERRPRQPRRRARAPQELGERGRPAPRPRALFGRRAPRARERARRSWAGRAPYGRRPRPLRKLGALSAPAPPLPAPGDRAARRRDAPLPLQRRRLRDEGSSGRRRSSPLTTTPLRRGETFRNLAMADVGLARVLRLHPRLDAHVPRRAAGESRDPRVRGRPATRAARAPLA